MAIRLHELCGSDPARVFSPYCWRVRMALAHKGLAHEARPWRFTDKAAIADAGTEKVPVLRDGTRTVHDSWAILEYLEDRYPGHASLFGGEGGFGLEASGQGLSVYGAVDVTDLAPGERDVIHTGHVIAYDLGMQFTTRRAVEGRSIQSMKSGEGLVSTSSGPGACSCSHATRRRSLSGPPSSCPRRTSRAASAGCSTDRQGVRAAASRVGRWRRSRPTCRGCRTRRPTPPARGSR